MTTSQTYSLWLRPHGDVALSLQRHIDRLSKANNTPSFEPHVTLLGGLTGSEAELIQRTRTLASALQPLSLILTQADTGQRFYQSIFVHIKETDDLISARKMAKRIFGVNSNDKEDRFPHLSLMYGAVPTKQKERILNAMGREFHIRFLAKNLFLVATGGKPKEWKKINTAEFGQVH